MPPTAAPSAQSWQFAAEAEMTVFMVSEPWRHVPAFLKAHHAGSDAPDEARSITISCPDDCRMSWPSSNEPTSRLLAAVFELQAKVLLIAPASPAQADQRRLTPGAAAATPTVRARSRPHSSVTLFICLPPGPLH